MNRVDVIIVDLIRSDVIVGTTDVVCCAFFHWVLGLQAIIHTVLVRGQHNKISQNVKVVACRIHAEHQSEERESGKTACSVYLVKQVVNLRLYSQLIRGTEVFTAVRVRSKVSGVRTFRRCGIKDLSR